MAWVAVAGMVIQAAGQMKAANAQAAAGKYNAQLAERNATLARQTGEMQADQQRRQAEQVLGGMRANYAANGVALEGSPLELLAQSASNAEYDNQMIRYQAGLKAAGLQGEAALDRMGAKSAKEAGYISAAGTLMRAAGSAYSSGAGQSLFSGS